MRDRLPVDLRNAAPPEFDALPFTSLYLLDDEFAAELANRTVHGVLHIGWVSDGTGGFRGQMAVLVKPHGDVRDHVHGGHQAVPTPRRLPGDDRSVGASLADAPGPRGAVADAGDLNGAGSHGIHGTPASSSTSTHDTSLEGTHAMHPFRTAIEARDIDGAVALLSDDVVFRSPIVFTPYHGRAAVRAILRAVARVFDDFAYVREIGAANAQDHALVFRARIGKRISKAATSYTSTRTARSTNSW